MEPWKISLLFGLVQLAATFGGMVSALKFMASRIDKAEASATRAHDRISEHVHDHATGALQR